MFRLPRYFAAGRWQAVPLLQVDRAVVVTQTLPWSIFPKSKSLEEGRGDTGRRQHQWRPALGLPKINSLWRHFHSHLPPPLRYGSNQSEQGKLLSLAEFPLELFHRLVDRVFAGSSMIPCLRCRHVPPHLQTKGSIAASRSRDRIDTMLL